MFKDTRQALEQLESALLEDEKFSEAFPEEDLAPEDPALLLEDSEPCGENPCYSNHIRLSKHRPVRHFEAYNADHLDTQTLSDALLEPSRRGSLTGLAICACLLALGIFAVAVWWLIRYRGVF